MNRYEIQNLSEAAQTEMLRRLRWEKLAADIIGGCLITNASRVQLGMILGSMMRCLWGPMPE